MAISLVGQAAAGTTSVTLPAHQVGDLIIIFAYRNATTAPSKPAGWTDAPTNPTASGNSNSYRVAYKIARSTGETSGTWTNANVVQCVIYRGTGGVGVSAGATKAASTTANIPTLTLQNGAGTSWVVAFAGSRQTTAQGTPLAGATTSRGTQAGTTSNAIAADTNAGVASFAATTSSNNTSVTSSGFSMEILPGNALSETLTDVYPGTSLDGTKWNSTAGAGSVVVAAGLLTLTPAANSAGDGQQVISVSPFCLMGSYIFTKMSSVLSGDEFSTLFANVVNGGGDRLVLTQYNGNLEARYTLAGAETTVLSSAYNATTMKWIKISESAGTITFWYSADSVSWTSFTTLANPFGLIAMNVGLETYENAATLVPGAAIYDNFNTVDVVTTTRTQTGLARITAAATQTEPGKARITAAAVQTILGKAQIRNTTTQTIQGKGRLTATTTQTTTGRARMQATVLRTQTGLARIGLVSSQTLQGLARVSVAVATTITALVRITATTTRTILGVANIRATTSQTIPGKSRILRTVTQDLDGVARVEIATTQDVPAKSRITATTVRTIPGQARVTATGTQTLAGLSRIAATVLQTLLGKAKMLGAVSIVTQDLLGKSRVTARTTRAIKGKAKILSTVSAPPPSVIFLTDGRLATRLGGNVYLPL